MGQVDGGECWFATSDPVARRLGRFFADLMVTLAEEGTDGAEAPDAVGVLWRDRRSRRRPGEEAVAARRAAGTTDVTVTDVWLEVAGALQPARLDDVGSGSGAIGLP
jgi:hypothetical protein